MEAIATSFLGFSVSAERDANRALQGDGAPELAALGITPVTDKEESQTFSDELQLALAGMLFGTPKELLTETPPQQPDDAVSAIAGDATKVSPLSETLAPIPSITLPSATTNAPTIVQGENSANAEPVIPTQPSSLPSTESAEVAPTQPVQGGENDAVSPDFEDSVPAMQPATDLEVATKTTRLEQTLTLPPDSFIQASAARPEIVEKPIDPVRITNDVKATTQEVVGLAPVDATVVEFAQYETHALAARMAEQEPGFVRDKKAEAPSLVSHHPVFHPVSGRPVENQQPADAPPPIEQIAKSILTKADLIHSGGTTDFQLRLDPPELGPVRVHLTATDDTVHLRLIVHEAAARQQLETQMESLRQRLEDAGVSLGRFDVLQDHRHSSGNWQPPHRLFVEPAVPLTSSTRQTSYLRTTSSTARAGLVDVMA